MIQDITKDGRRYFQSSTKNIITKGDTGMQNILIVNVNILENLQKKMEAAGNRLQHAEASIPHASHINMYVDCGVAQLVSGTTKAKSAKDKVQ